MFVVLYRALDAMGELPSPSGFAEIEDFSDYMQISGYAVEPLQLFVQAGIIQGSGGKLTPLALSKRSHASQVIFNLLNK